MQDIIRQVFGSIEKPVAKRVDYAFSSAFSYAKKQS